MSFTGIWRQQVLFDVGICHAAPCRMLLTFGQGALPVRRGCGALGHKRPLPAPPALASSALKGTVRGHSSASRTAALRYAARRSIDRPGDAMSLQMKLGAITLDCPDPLSLAEFYEGHRPRTASEVERGLRRAEPRGRTLHRLPAGRPLPGSHLARPDRSPTAPHLLQRGDGGRPGRGRGPIAGVGRGQAGSPTARRGQGTGPHRSGRAPLLPDQTLNHRLRSGRHDAAPCAHPPPPRKGSSRRCGNRHASAHAEGDQFPMVVVHLRGPLQRGLGGGTVGRSSHEPAVVASSYFWECPDKGTAGTT